MKKHDAAKGLADYDSTNDYKMGEFGFTRILPAPSLKRNVAHGPVSFPPTL